MKEEINLFNDECQLNIISRDFGDHQQNGHEDIEHHLIEPGEELTESGDHILAVSFLDAIQSQHLLGSKVIVQNDVTKAHNVADKLDEVAHQEGDRTDGLNLELLHGPIVGFERHVSSTNPKEQLILTMRVHGLQGDDRVNEHGKDHHAQGQEHLVILDHDPFGAEHEYPVQSNRTTAHGKMGRLENGNQSDAHTELRSKELTQRNGRQKTQGNIDIGQSTEGMDAEVIEKQLIDGTILGFPFQIGENHLQEVQSHSRGKKQSDAQTNSGGPSPWLAMVHVGKARLWNTCRRSNGQRPTDQTELVVDILD